jgi:hypothetical protein
MESGIKPRTWRYLTRHGSRLFKRAWEMTSKAQTLPIAKEYLLALQKAGLEAPPPPSFIKMWLHAVNVHLDNQIRMNKDFTDQIHPMILRAGLREADIRRRDNQLQNFAEEFIHIASALTPKKFSPDKNQSRMDWNWLTHYWQKANIEQRLLASMTDSEATWKNTLPAITINNWQIEPIESVASLVRESLNLKNCIRVKEQSCVQKMIELYVIKDATSQKTKCCIEYDIDNGRTLLSEIRGVANIPPIGEFIQIADLLLPRLKNQTISKSM